MGYVVAEATHDTRHIVYLARLFGTCSSYTSNYYRESLIDSYSEQFNFKSTATGGFGAYERGRLDDGAAKAILELCNIFNFHEIQVG